MDRAPRRLTITLYESDRGSLRAIRRIVAGAPGLREEVSESELIRWALRQMGRLLRAEVPTGRPEDGS